MHHYNRTKQPRDQKAPIFCILTPICGTLVLEKNPTPSGPKPPIFCILTPTFAILTIDQNTLATKKTPQYLTGAPLGAVESRPTAAQRPKETQF